MDADWRRNGSVEAGQQNRSSDGRFDALVAEDHLLRKIERVRDYDWLYECLSPYYCHDNGRNGTDPVVLVKMVLIQYLYWIQTVAGTNVPAVFLFPGLPDLGTIAHSGLLAVADNGCFYKVWYLKKLIQLSIT